MTTAAELEEFFATNQRKLEADREAAAEKYRQLDVEIGARVRKLREDRRVSRKELAAGLALSGHDLSESSIADIERGARGLRVSEAVLLGNIFGVPISYFVEQTDDIDRAKAAELLAVAEHLRERAARLLGED
ncbi:helix-turn-helix domain-containing protein [Aeromicrobium flavum]|nr:helix-turn-helix transcriptional regulator [Aeromicrobium flavum]